MNGPRFLNRDSITLQVLGDVMPHPLPRTARTSKGFLRHGAPSLSGHDGSKGLWQLDRTTVEERLGLFCLGRKPAWLKRGSVQFCRMQNLPLFKHPRGLNQSLNFSQTQFVTRVREGCCSKSLMNVFDQFGVRKTFEKSFEKLSAPSNSSTWKQLIHKSHGFWDREPQIGSKVSAFLVCRLLQKHQVFPIIHHPIQSILRNVLIGMQDARIALWRAGVHWLTAATLAKQTNHIVPQVLTEILQCLLSGRWTKMDKWCWVVLQNFLHLRFVFKGLCQHLKLRIKPPLVTRHFHVSDQALLWGFDLFDHGTVPFPKHITWKFQCRNGIPHLPGTASQCQTQPTCSMTIIVFAKFREGLAGMTVIIWALFRLMHALQQHACGPKLREVIVARICPWEPSARFHTGLLVPKGLQLCKGLKQLLHVICSLQFHTQVQWHQGRKFFKDQRVLIKQWIIPKRFQSGQVSITRHSKSKKFSSQVSITRHSKSQKFSSQVSITSHSKSTKIKPSVHHMSFLKTFFLAKSIPSCVSDCMNLSSNSTLSWKKLPCLKGLYGKLHKYVLDNWDNWGRCLTSGGAPLTANFMSRASLW